MMTPIADLFPAERHIALVWADQNDLAAIRKLADRHGGRLQAWPDGAKDITQFPFSHSILWSRRADPTSSWLQCAYSVDDREEVVAQVKSISKRYPDIFKQHMEVIRSSSGGVRVIGVPALFGLPDHGKALDELIGFCIGEGMTVMNPHSFVVEEGGFVGDIDSLIELKRSADPYNILNPGKLGAQFFEDRTWRSATADAEREVVAPESLPA